MLRVGQLRFAWSPPEWVVATSLCQSAGRYPPPHGILKENLLWVRTFDTIEELRAALVEFATRYNETWLLARHGYRTPAQVRADQCRLDQNTTADLILAHSWYPNECCADKDCHPVPCEEISEDENGAMHWKYLIFEGSQIRASPDHECHVCHLLEEGRPVTPICIFTQKKPSA